VAVPVKLSNPSTTRAMPERFSVCSVFNVTVCDVTVTSVTLVSAVKSLHCGAVSSA